MVSLLYRLADRARDRARRAVDPQGAAGKRGEDLAHRYLRQQGFTIVARNWRPRAGAGEIDLIAWDGDALVFVEVKARSSEAFGTPDRAVDPDKETHLRRAARSYARQAGVAWERARFDIVNVILQEPPRISLLKNAFPHA